MPIPNINIYDLIVKKSNGKNSGNMIKFHV